MKDKYGRSIDYMRISVTDRCNMRCKYCMPASGVSKLSHDDVLSLEEIAEIGAAAAALGVRKFRITGGEPLVRRGIVDLCAQLSALPGIEEIALTTNGLLLPEMAEDLKAAGVKRVNISIDTLDAQKYAEITRGGRLEKALEGIRAALRVGLTPLKLNAVLIDGFNDDEIESFVELTRLYPVEMRFIEMMPIGEGADLWDTGYLSNEAVLERVPELMPFDSGRRCVAKLYKLPGAPGSVGLINPISCQFCDSCNRLRLTSDGKLKPCLHSSLELDIRGLHGEALREALRASVLAKPLRRSELSAASPSEAGRRMNQIGG